MEYAQDLWLIYGRSRPSQGIFSKWMAELKVASRKLHAFAGRHATDIWDCGSLHNMYGISMEYLGICIWNSYGLSLEQLWNVAEHNGIYVESHRILLNIYGMQWNILEYLWNIMEYLWNLMEYKGTSWNPVGYRGITMVEYLWNIIDQQLGYIMDCQGQLLGYIMDYRELSRIDMGNIVGHIKDQHG